MPTENRSSNTEQMVSVQRDEVERLVKLLAYQAHPYPSPHAEYWQGVLDQPAAQHLGNSKLVDNIHALLALDARGALVPSGIGGLAREFLESSAAALSAQHQGEPVAYAVFADNGNIRIWSTNCEAVGIKVMQEEGKQAVPLYLHPPTSDGFSAGDMADQGAKAFAARDPEVEQLSAQLADRESALTRILERCDAFIGDERGMRVQSVEAIREIAARAVAQKP
ncbi:hypothetical protein [Pseudomonas sp. DG56-2]|uniref:hypothetical protein n=1 Tax=Pseudomonas sp. DG56-2 TaxID=2320270 RepID=UPI0010A5D2B2|nr:hypothetical protein [Pseudomonas sp. DG56-2]